MKSFPNKTAGRPRVHYLLQCALLQSNVSYFVFSCVAGRDCLRHVLAQGGQQGTREVAAAPGFPATAEGFSRFGAGGRFGHSLCLHVARPGTAPSSLPVRAGEQPARHPPSILLQRSHHGCALGWGPEHRAWLLEGRAVRSGPSPAAPDYSPAGK